MRSSSRKCEDQTEEKAVPLDHAGRVGRGQNLDEESVMKDLK